MEEWKVIESPEFQGNYEVSNLGRIRTIPHECCDTYGRKRWVDEHIKATRSTPKGYRIINVRYNGKHYTFKVHRIVASAFIPNPNNLPEVNHKDENRMNIFSGIFKSRDKPTDRTAGSSYSFFLGNSSAGKYVTERCCRVGRKDFCQCRSIIPDWKD